MTRISGDAADARTGANVESIRPPHKAPVQNVGKMQSMARLPSGRAIAWQPIGLTVRYWGPQPSFIKKAPFGPARPAGLFIVGRLREWPGFFTP